MADAPEFDDNEPIAPLAQQSKPAAPEFDDNEPIEPLGGAPAPIAPALTAQQRYRQSLKGYHDQGTENPDVAPGYVSPETSKAFAEAKSNTSSLGSQWGDVGIGAAKGLAGGVSGGWLGDIESIGRLPFQIPGVRENIADVSPHTAIPTSEEGGYLGPRGYGAFNAPETPEEKGGAFIGSMLSPNVFSGGAKAVGKGIKHIAGQATFVGPKALEIAYSAGKEGGEAAQAFRENITKSVDLADIIPEVKSSIDNMRAARNAGYVSDMKELGKNVTPLNFDEIDKAVARSTQVKTYKGQDLSPSTTKIRQEMNDAIKEWRSLDPAEYHTPVDMDALKQKLGDLMENTLPHTPERVVASDIYNAVRQTIIKQAPEYAPIMKAYENSSAQIKEIENALSLGKNASADTGLRKLQSILRDNVNASYGSREQLAKYLIANGSPNLMEKLAGQALIPYTPRGLGKLSQNVGAHMVAIAAAASTGVVAPILTFMAGAAISSPRLMGNLSYLSGVAARYGEKIPAKAAIRTGILADTVTPDGTPTRATGGSVFDKMHAAKHMADGGGLESFIKSLGSQGAAFGTQTEQEQAGFQRDPISELVKGAYNSVEHLAKENIDNANLLATGNRDQFSGKPGFDAATLVMGTGAVAGVPMRAGEAVLGSGPIRAYHGSPYDFDKFDASKIGTGEGAQSYGRGLYFAEQEATAKAYRDMLQGKGFKIPDDVAALPDEQRFSILRAANAHGAHPDPLEAAKRAQWGSPELRSQPIESIADKIARSRPPDGRMYEVNINADPAKFLDWDKPLGQQPANVQNLVANGPTRWGGNDFVRGQLTSPSGEAIYKRIATDSVGKQGYGADHNAYAADLVNKAGIPGIKYLDQGSRPFSADALAGVQRAEAKIERLRASGETGYKLDDALQELQSAKRGVGDLSSNYVVFDPKIIEIMRKYGMTLPAATAAYEAMKTDQEKTGFKKGGSVFDKMKRASK